MILNQFCLRKVANSIKKSLKTVVLMNTWWYNSMPELYSYNSPVNLWIEIKWLHSRAAGDVRQLEEDRGFQKEAHRFYSSVLWLHPGRVTQWVIHTKSCTHTHQKKKERKKRKHTNAKCYVKCSFHSEQFSTISSLCVEKRVDPYWSVLYRHQFHNCDRRRQSNMTAKPHGCQRDGI